MEENAYVRNYIRISIIDVLAYRGYSILWVAPVCALVVGLTGGLDCWECTKIHT